MTSTEMRQIEAKCAECGLPSSVLMENAGRAAALEIAHLVGPRGSRNILLLIGPGNNGGDGLVAARYLHDSGARVSLYLVKERPADANFTLTQERGIPTVTAEADSSMDALDDNAFAASRSCRSACSSAWLPSTSDPSRNWWLSICPPG